MAVLGLILQVAGWTRLRRLRSFSTQEVTLLTIGVAMTILGATIVREGIRLAQVEISERYADHAASAAGGGIWVFLFFLVLNVAVVIRCVRLIPRQ